MSEQKAASTGAPAVRLASMDSYRGFVMLLMMAEVLRFTMVSHALPESAFWRFLSFHQSHAPWFGCSLHDLIQPSFSFLVGVALPFSIASRIAKGQSRRKMVAHAMWRSFLLIALGVFLRSMNYTQTYFTFEDTLSQIGLGYTFLFLLGFRSVRVQWASLALILVGYWLAFALYPLPGPGFDYAAVGVPPDWAYNSAGLAAHWNMNSNLAWAFDTWFLNLFPREHPFLFNNGGYSTLSFIPTLGTMILGLIAGGWLRSGLTDRQRLRRLAWAGAAGWALGWLAHVSGICPVVKRIWTPSWTLYSGGWCFLLLGLFYLVIDYWKIKKWAFPLIVIGMNSIAAYCSDWLFAGFITNSMKIHLGPNFFKLLGDVYAPFLEGMAVLLILWSILFWMYRRKLFLKI
jgi:heparan-alpha-glucosaminide N-acetyltransferase